MKKYIKNLTCPYDTHITYKKVTQPIRIKSTVYPEHRRPKPDAVQSNDFRQRDTLFRGDISAPPI